MKGSAKKARFRQAYAWSHACAGVFVCAHAAAPHGASAQYQATARTTVPLASTHNQDPTAAGTAVSVADDVRVQPSLAEVLLSVPGVRTAQLGGYGASTTLAVRGSDAEQTTVYFDDIPLNSDGSAFDLSTIPSWLLERVEVYRGGLPLFFGSGAIGGVLRLVPREDAGSRHKARMTFGSFGQRGLEVASTTNGSSPARLSWTAALGVTGSRGDFRYRDDSGTAFDAADDRTRRRTNAEVLDGYALLRLRARVFGGTLRALWTGFERTGGVPGPAVQPTLHTRRAIMRALNVVAFERLGGNASESRDAPEEAPWRVHSAASIGVEKARFNDIYNEIGLGSRDADDDRFRTNARFGGHRRFGRLLKLAGLMAWSWERYEPDNRPARVRESASNRHSLSGSVELESSPRVFGMRTQLRASGRAEVVDARLSEIRDERAGEVAASTRVAPTFRVAAAAEPFPSIAIVASASSALRFPSMTELFGDRGYLQGDTRLRPERAHTVEAGVVLRGKLGIFSGTGELRAFTKGATDLIRYVRTSQYVAVPQNIAHASIRGAELGTQLRLGRHIDLAASLTFTQAEDESGRTLPLRPRIAAYARPEVHTRALGPFDDLAAYAEFTHVGSNFVDAANTTTIGARTIAGAGCAASFLRNRVQLSLSARNVFDVLTSDVLGFPLAGRSFAVSFVVQTEQAR